MIFDTQFRLYESSYAVVQSLKAAGSASEVKMIFAPLTCHTLGQLFREIADWSEIVDVSQ